jgi:putative flippase GtrA
LIDYLFSHKLIRYALIGGISTLIHISIASLYIFFIYDSLFQSNIIGFLVAYIFSYTIQSKFVFEREISRDRAIKYFLVQVGALVVAILLSDILDGFNSYIKSIIVALLLPLVTFFIHKFWTFKGEN